MAAKIKEGMTGGQVADIIEQNFENLENKFQQLSDQFDHTKEDINRTLDEYQSQVDDAYGSIAVQVDEEDTTSEKGKIKLKDRAYEPDKFSGKGYKILRKNIVCNTETKEAKNILTQDMINEPNTVYEIRYDFDLNGETINIPEGCTLKFEGGSLSNSTLNGNNTEIISVYTKKIFDNLNLNNSFISTTIYPEYFGALADSITECSTAINLASEFCRSIKGNLKFTQGTYLVSDTLILGAINVDGNGAIIKSNNIINKPIIDIDPRFGQEWSSFSERTRFIKNLRIDCNSEDNIGLQVYGDGQTFSNIHIREVGWVGFYAYDSGNAILTDFLIEGSDKSLDESVGLALEAPDWQISNGIIQNVSTGVITTSNFFTNIHTWGYSTRKRMITHLLVYQGKCSISDWYFDTVNCRSDDNVEHSLHPDWLYGESDDIKRRRYIGNAAIMCLTTGSVNCANVRCFQASGQSQGDIKPIFLFNSQNTINNLVNVEVPNDWIKYHYNSSPTYIENTNTDTVINLTQASNNTLIKLCSVEQIANYNSITFNIQTSCNGRIINSIVSIYNNNNSCVAYITAIQNTTMENYNDIFKETLYIKENSVYYNLVTKSSYVKSIMISYINTKQNIRPELSTDNVEEAIEIKSSYIPIYEHDKIPVVRKNLETVNLVCSGNNNTIKINNISNITKYHTQVYTIDVPLNTNLVHLIVNVYNGDTANVNICAYGYYEMLSIFPIKAYVYNDNVYINISTENSYVKDVIITYYNILNTNQVIEVTDENIDNQYEVTIAKLDYHNGITKQLITGTTAQRPTDINISFQYFDTTLNKPIWWTGSKWVDATGADV